MKNIFKMFIITLLLTSCQGKVGNKSGTLSSGLNSLFPPPKMEYRLKTNLTYEIIGIEPNYLGSFLVPLEYYDEEEDYGTLPVTGIGRRAFESANAVFVVLVAYNIHTIGYRAFANWQPYQTIYFLISLQEVATDPDYYFEPGWDEDCQAQIFWSVDVTNLPSNPLII